MGYTLQQLQQMGATPVIPAQNTGKGLTWEQLKAQGATPVTPINNAPAVSTAFPKSDPAHQSFMQKLTSPNVADTSIPTFTPTDVGGRTDAGVIGSTAGNQAKSVANLGVGVGNFLNPINSGKNIGGAIGGAYNYGTEFEQQKQSQEAVKGFIPQLQAAITKNKSIGRDTSNLERLLKEAGGSPAPSIPEAQVAKELPNAVYQNVASDAIKKGVNGDIHGAVQSIAQDPQQLAPYFLAGKGAIKKYAPAIDSAISTTAKPFVDNLNPAPLTGAITSKVAPDMFTKDVSTMRAEKITQGLQEQNVRLKSVGNSFNSNTQTYATPEGISKTVTPIDTFSKYNIAPEVDKGTILMGDYKTGQGALGKIKENVASIDGDINTHLVDSGKSFTVEDMRQKAIEIAKADPELRQAGQVKTTINKLNTRFNDYLSSYGDKIDIQEVNNIRKVANKDWSPETVDTSRIVGDVGRDIVYHATDDLVVKKLLQEQGDLLAARKYAESLNGTKVVGGRLGNMAMRTAGAVVGSTVEKLPIAGPIIGMIGGEYLARVLQQSQFKSLGAEFKALFQRSKITEPSQSANTIPSKVSIEKEINDKTVPNTDIKVKKGDIKVNNFQKDSYSATPADTTKSQSELIKVNTYNRQQFPKYITKEQVDGIMVKLEAMKQQGKTIDMKSLVEVTKQVKQMSDIKLRILNKR